MNVRGIVLRVLPAVLAAMPAFPGQTPAQTQQDSGINLIIRADDIASCHAANLACVRTATEGIATSIEIMAPCSWFPEAAALLNEHPDIDVGVHLTLTSEWVKVKWGPLSDAPSLVDNSGYLPPQTRPLRDTGTGTPGAATMLADVERELRAQIELALASLPNVTHLTGHMGVADVTPEVHAIVEKLAAEYGLPYEVPGIERFAGFGNGTIEEKVATMIENLDALTPGLWLFVEHPGMDTPEMQAMGTRPDNNVAADRNAVTAVWTDPRVREAIERCGINLVSYGDLLNKR